MKSGPGIYRYGSPRTQGEGLRIGCARHLPRGVRREDWSRKNFFDLRLPLLAPTAPLVKAYLGGSISWAVFRRKYRAEMKAPECRQVIDLLAGLSLATPFALGCFCEDETHCHRSLLQRLVVDSRARISPAAVKARVAHRSGAAKR
jgi:uncharacterized protein YeaO (DUF488 family)